MIIILINKKGICMKSNSTPLDPSSNIADMATNISIEKLQTTVLFLTTKYAQTRELKFAQATYQHLCMINDHTDASPELKYFAQSLIMKWRLIACNNSSRFSSLN